MKRSKGCSVMKILHCSPWESAGGGNVCQGSLHWGELGLMQTGEPGASPVVALLAPLRCSSLVGTGSILSKPALDPEKPQVHQQAIPSSPFLMSTTFPHG